MVTGGINEGRKQSKVFDFMFTSQHHLCRFTPLYNIQQFSFFPKCLFSPSESEVILFSWFSKVKRTQTCTHVCGVRISEHCWSSQKFFFPFDYLLKLHSWKRINLTTVLHHQRATPDWSSTLDSLLVNCIIVVTFQGVNFNCWLLEDGDEAI